jgi:hypothetical protein
MDDRDRPVRSPERDVQGCTWAAREREGDQDRQVIVGPG